MTTYTPLLHLPEVASNQDQKEATINTALAILEAAMNDVLSVSLASGNVTLNTDQYTKYFHHQFTGHSVARTVTVPNTARWFAVENQGSATITFQITGSAGLTAQLLAGKIGVLISDGTDLRFVVPDAGAGLGLLQDLSDVNFPTGTPTNGQLLRWVAADSQWEPWTLTLAFSQLSDFPGAYAANNGKLLAVKADGTGLEWVTSATNVHTFLDLSDTPSSYTGAASRTVKVNSGGTALVFAQPVLTEAIDFPATYTGNANKVLKVNGTANGVVFATMTVADLSDGPGAPSVGTALQYVRVKSDGSGLEYGTGTGGPDHFYQLVDTPSSYTGASGKLVRVNGAENGLIFNTLNFTELGDSAGAYTGNGGKFVKVNSGATGLQYAQPTVQDLSNGPGTFTSNALKVVRVNAGATALEYRSLVLTDVGQFPSSLTGQGGKFVQVRPDETGLQFVANSYTTNFLALTDTPSSYAGQAGKYVVVDPTTTGLVFASLPMIPTKLGQLADVEDGTGTPAQGAFLRWIDGVWQADPYTAPAAVTALAQLTVDVDTTTVAPSLGDVLTWTGLDTPKWKPAPIPASTVNFFTDLGDVPSSYAGAAGQYVVVNDAADGMHFRSLPMIPTLLGQLADVEDGTGTPAEGYVLTWKNAVWQAEPPSNLKPTESMIIAVGDETTALTTGTGKVTFRMPYGFTLTGVRASLTTASSSGTPTVDIKVNGSSCLSTLITLDATEKTSTTAATPPVISTSSIADDAEITIDVTAAGTGATGLKVYLIGHQ